MELRQVEAFFWIATLGSFSAAAKRLFITQSAISSRIQALESEIGQPLLLRGSGHVQLTERGHDFLDQSRRLLDLAAEMRAGGPGQGALRGTVRIGAVNTVAHTWLPRLVQEASRIHPEIDIDLHIGVSNSIQQGLLRHDVDVAIISDALSAPGIQTKSLCRYPLGWVASPDLATGAVFSLHELSRHRLMTYERGTTVHRLISAMFRSHGVYPVRLSGSNSVAAMVEVALHGIGICILPIPVIAEHVRTGRLTVLRSEPALPDIEFRIAHAVPTVNRLAPAIVEIATRLYEQGEMSAD